MFMLHGRIGAKPGKRDELLAILAEGELAGSMPGCRLYLVAVDLTDADGVWVTEVWESEEAHTSSLQLEAVRHRITRALPFIDTDGFQRQELHAHAGIPGGSQAPAQS